MSRFATAALLLLAGIAPLAALAGTSQVVTMSYKANFRVNPFQTVNAPDFAFVDGATVSIEFGYVPNYDRLYFDYSGQFPITGSFNAANGVLYLTGQATTSEYIAAINSVVFFTTMDDGLPRTITWTFGTNAFFMTLTEHVYKYIPQSVSWTAAKAMCEQMTYFGAPGYLATITSADEQLELGQKATTTYWLGANDVAQFNVWQWVAGPEANMTATSTFWNGQSQYLQGQLVENAFAAWNRFQPTNLAGSGNDYVYLVNSADYATAYWAVGTDSKPLGGFICEFGAPWGTQVPAGIAGSVQLFVDCGLYADSGDCTNHRGFGCQWNAAVGMCTQITCGQYHTEQLCRTDGRCAWNVDTEAGTCAPTRCASFGAVACQADTSCSWTGTVCKPALCEQQNVPCNCNSQSGCTWRNGQCNNDNTIDCTGMDVIFMMDATPAMAQTFGRYTQGFLGLVDSILAADLSLTGTPAGTIPGANISGMRVGFVSFGQSAYVTRTVGSMGRLTGSLAEMQADLNDHLQNFNPRGPGRVINSALNTAASMFDGAIWRNRVVIILSAGNVSDASILAQRFSANSATGGVLATLNKLNVAIVGVALKPTAVETVGAYQASMTLASLTANPTMNFFSTLENVITRAVYGICGNQTSLARAVRPNAPASQLCTAFTSPAMCSTNPTCGWDSAAQMCLNSACTKYCTTSACNADTSCNQPAGAEQCQGLCMSLNETQCGVSQGIGACMFNFPTDSCMNLPCVGNPTEDGCIADAAGCYFNPLNAVPCQPLPCNTDDSALCSRMGCTWNGLSCFQDTCAQFTNAQSCGSLPNCGWSNNACSSNYCGKKATEASCQADFSCQWSTANAPAACVPAPCTYYNVDAATAQTNCQSNSSCLWASALGTQMCMQKTCDRMTRSCDCAKLPGCVWRNEQCKDDTFVQCPATDVLFLVESTPVMFDTFGRHPIGYVGILESIRSWARQAPFSATLASSGFRVGLINYGQQRPFVVPSEIGGGSSNFTSDVNSLIGPNMILDYFISNAETYATSGVTGSVLLGPALKKALDIYTNEGSTGRTMLVVVLGNSAITDKDPLMSTYLNQLEAWGVKVFVNLVRRFSYITPVDDNAAQYLMPVASDPATTFFTFTTIDEMSINLLDNFCDPSTPTGKVLGVSRDLELPCTWLNGETECNIQGSCKYNAAAVRTCPLPGQCPTAGCRSLPAAIAKYFSCDNCRFVSGEFQCSYAKLRSVPIGVCQKSTCATTCSAQCDSTTGCRWNTESKRCELNYCQPLTDMTTCNKNLGCVWVGGASSGTCEASICGKLRTPSVCTGYIKQEGANQYNPCAMRSDLTPGICVQMRCPQLDQTTCAALSTQCSLTVGLTYRPCEDLTCSLYIDGETCEFDSRCYWNPFEATCNKRVPDCVLSGYSDWAPCSSNCGPAVTYKSRAILQAPSALGGLTCPEVAAVGCRDGKVANCDAQNQPNDVTLTVLRSCTAPPEPTGLWIPPNPSVKEGQWPTSCTTYCEGIKDRNTCLLDAACRWVGDSCRATTHITCAALNETACSSTDQCAFNSLIGLCEPVLSVCNFTTPDTCNMAAACSWRGGLTANQYAASLGLPIQLVNPGQAPIYPFVGLDGYTSDLLVNGASVTVEANYERTKDVLSSTYNLKVRSQWIEQSGTLLLFGTASVTEYMKTIRFVTFETTSTRTSPRRITYSFGNNTVFSSATRHHYLAVKQAGASYDFALSYCDRKRLFGLQGYLATVLSSDENQIITSKLFANGWISGDDASNGQFAYSSGPEKGIPFWKGPSAPMGGLAINNSYTNWAPPTTINTANLSNAAALVNGEPVLNVGAGGLTGIDRVYLARSGYWESRILDTVNVEGFICEFGNMPNDVYQQFPIGGATVVGIAGCVPQACVWHSNEQDCNIDIECNWNNGKCEVGCASKSTETECSRAPLCKWDTSILPPICGINMCAPLSISACAMNSQCEWDPTTQCRYKIGCAMFPQSQCASYPTCMWNGNVCTRKSCSSYAVIADCRATPQCQWSFQTSTCTDQLCTFGAQSLCNADNRCTWNAASSIVTGFSPGTGYVFPFTSLVEPPTASYNVDGITVIIASGYQKGFDVLAVDPDVSQAFNSMFDDSTGTLFITVSPTSQITAFQAFRYLQTVRFSSKSSNIIQRQLSYVLSANTVYVSSTRTFYKLQPSLAPQTFASAQQACVSSSLFGLPSALAEINSQEVQQTVKKLKGKGWIGATGNAAGTWSWSTTNVPFWRGTGSLGLPVPLANNSGTSFAQWDLGEPTMTSAAAYMDSNGFWRSVVPTATQVNAFCQYGPITPFTDAVSGLRLLIPSGCFVAPCLSLPMTQCNANPTCRWSALRSECVRDTACLPAGTPDACNIRQGCYWDFGVSLCQQDLPNECNRMSNRTTCIDNGRCQWKANLLPTDPTQSLGGCVYRGCGVNPVQSSCSADPTCKWTSQGCISRLCGYLTSDSCWGDSLCMWTGSVCQATPCAGRTQATCNVDTCSWNAATSTCKYTRCSTTQGKDFCLLDRGCLFLNGQCFKPNCVSSTPQDTCANNPQCFFFTALKSCDAAQCISNTDIGSCEQGQSILSKKPCIWDNGQCRQPTFAEQNAPVGVGECQKQKDPNLWWLWLFLAVILVLIGIIVWRLYISSRSGKGIFEPTRKNYKYNPHEQYAAELFEDAKVTGIETNVNRA